MDEGKIKRLLCMGVESAVGILLEYTIFI